MRCKAKVVRRFARLWFILLSVTKRGPRPQMLEFFSTLTAFLVTIHVPIAPYGVFALFPCGVAGVHLELTLTFRVLLWSSSVTGVRMNAAGNLGCVSSSHLRYHGKLIRKICRDLPITLILMCTGRICHIFFLQHSNSRSLGCCYFWFRYGRFENQLQSECCFHRGSRCRDTFFIFKNIMTL